MPIISRYSCNRCDFEMPTGWGSYMYAIDSEGKRVVCPHPGELCAAEQITGLDYSQARLAGRIGYARDCVCLSCLHQFELDLDRDARVCPRCAAAQVSTMRE